MDLEGARPVRVEGLYMINGYKHSRILSYYDEPRRSQLEVSLIFE